MRFVRLVPVVLGAIAAGCDKSPEPAASIPANKPSTPTERPAPPDDGRPERRSPAPREMPKLPLLTRETANAILRHQMDSIAADDDSRRTILYLADLGDREGLKVAQELLAKKDGKYEDLSAAALGVEGLLAYGEAGAGAQAIEVARAYDAEQTEADEWLAHMLARVQGDERKDAVARLVKIAADDADTGVQAVALGALAQAGAREAGDIFARIAADKEADAALRGAAMAGLLHASDPRAKDVVELLVKECTDPDSQGAAPYDVITGLGVPGVVEASPVIRRILDTLLANDAAELEFSAAEAGSAIARIHATGGGADLVPWLRQLHDKDNVNVEDETALALWALGDDTYAAAVAKQLEESLARYTPPGDTEWISEVLDTAGRRGVAAGAPFVQAVSTAAQLEPTADDKHHAVDFALLAMHRAAAHAFLKSTK